MVKVLEDGGGRSAPAPTSTIFLHPPPPSLLLVARPLPVLWLLRGDVGDGVPGVVNADKQQQQRRRADHEEAHRGIPLHSERGQEQRDVRDERKGAVPQPVFQQDRKSVV